LKRLGFFNQNLLKSKPQKTSQATPQPDLKTASMPVHSSDILEKDLAKEATSSFPYQVLLLLIIILVAIGFSVYYFIKVLG